MFHTEHIHMIIIYLSAKFHMPTSNGLLLMTIKHKAKHKFCTVAMLLFYILQKYYLNKRHNIFWSSVTTQNFRKLP